MPSANYNWATPALGGANNVPVDLASLASQIDATLKAIAARLPYARASGSFSAGQRSGASYTHVVTFPVGRFSVAPNVVANVANAASGSNALQICIGTVTASTAELVFLTDTGAALNNHWCTANWEATQMTPTSAGG